MGRLFDQTRSPRLLPIDPKRPGLGLRPELPVAQAYPMGRIEEKTHIRPGTAQAKLALAASLGRRLEPATVPAATVPAAHAAAQSKAPPRGSLFERAFGVAPDKDPFLRRLAELK